MSGWPGARATTGAQLNLSSATGPAGTDAQIALGLTNLAAVKGVQLDIMPFDESVLGFTNPFYRLGFEVALGCFLPNGRMIRILKPEHALATKVAAYESRGSHDPYVSTDLEDIVALADRTNHAGFRLRWGV